MTREITIRIPKTSELILFSHYLYLKGNYGIGW